MKNFSRRELLKGAGAAAGAAALAGPGRFGSTALAQAADKSAVVIVFLNGGYNALFGSPKSFSPAGTFSCSDGNILSLGNNLYVDKPTFGTLPAVALQNMAQIGVNHGISSHSPAKLASWTTANSRNFALVLANAMGGSGSRLACAALGATLPPGPRPEEGGISLQRISDLSPTLELFGARASAGLSRGQAKAALTAARTMSGYELAQNALSMQPGKEAYDTAINVLGQTSSPLDTGPIATAYGLAATATAVNAFATQMYAAEVMIKLGTKVVIAFDNSGWDTHTDSSGAVARQRMTDRILPALSTFLQRNLALAGYNITTAIIGDFARSLPNSDHAACISATVFGKHVKTGSTGNVDANVRMPTGTPKAPGFWAYLAAAAGVTTQPFGANPHALLK